MGPFEDEKHRVKKLVLSGFNQGQHFN